MKLSCLVAARPNSKYLAKFLSGYLVNTDGVFNSNDMELLVMLNEHDTWNAELTQLFPEYLIQYFHEDLGLGRHGLHKYLNELARRSTGDWIIYFCEDHFISYKGWNRKLEGLVEGLDPDKPHLIVPKFDNVGAMNHVISRGLFEAMGRRIGRHSHVDSYINAVARLVGDDFPIRVDDPWFHDFTHDKPSPMAEGQEQSNIPSKAIRFDHEDVERMVIEDANAVQDAL